MRLIDAEAFEETLKEYKVDSITTLATCLKVLRSFPEVLPEVQKSDSSSMSEEEEQEALE